MASPNPTARVIDCSNDEYHARPEYSRSQLEYLLSNPKLFHEYFIAKSCSRPDPTEAMIFGTRVHAFLLEPHLVLEIPKGVLSSSGAKSGGAWRAYEDQNRGKILLKESEIAPLKAIALEVSQHPAANEIVFGDTQKEMAIIWQDKATGIWLRVKLDGVRPTLIADVKTTTDIGPREFASEICKRHYDFQAAMYQEGYFQLTGERLPFVFIPIQKATPSEPYPQVATYHLDEKFLEMGRAKFIKVTNEFVRCHKARRWKAEDHGQIIKLSPPAYLLNQSQWSI